MANPSNAPTNIKVYPIPGVGVEVHAVFHQSNNLPATYARFQVSTDPNFGTTVYDSGQVSINPINDGTEGVMIFTWVSSSQGTYYYRLCFWDNNNYTQTSLTVWNGVTLGESAVQQAIVRPVSDYSVQLTIYPTSPTTHYDKVNETTQNGDTNYVYTPTNSQDKIDKYNAGPSNISLSTFKRIDSVVTTLWIRSYAGYANHFGFECNSGEYTTTPPVVDTTYRQYDHTWTTNPDTGLAWTLDDVNHLIIGVRLSATVNDHLYCTQVYATINYYNYVVNFTPPGDNILTVGYPTISDIQVSNNRENYSFTTVVNDTYSKPPMVTLSINNQAYLMDYVSRTGTGPYNYTYQKMLTLEKGDYQYHIEVGNVWTTLIGDTRFLHVDYDINEDPYIEVYILNRKINSWNHVLTEDTLPNYNTIEFDTDEEIQSNIIVKFVSNDIRTYRMQVQNISKIPGGYHIRAIDEAKENFDLDVTCGSQSINSLDLIKSLLPAYSLIGALPQTIYLQSFIDETIINIIQRIAIINNALAYARNNRLFFYDLGNTNALFKMSKNDPDVTYSSDLSSIVNYVKEYYLEKQYPVPATALTNNDSSNWAGTVTSEQWTKNSIPPPSGSPTCLHGNGTIYRTVNFNWQNFDKFNISWSPDTATTLEIRLETDASNYRKYVRTYSGPRGSGFVLTGSSQTSEVSKTITFNTKYIAEVKGTVTSPCKVKISFSYQNNVVYQTNYQTVDSSFDYVVTPIQCDTITLTFTNLYPVGTTYGVNCTELYITEYVQTYQVTSSYDITTYNQEFYGTTNNGFTPANFPGGGWNLNTSVVLGQLPSLQGNEFYQFSNTWASFETSYKDSSGVIHTEVVNCNVNPRQTGGNTWILDISALWLAPGATYQTLAHSPVVYHITISKIAHYTVGKYVWIYQPYYWQQSYNLWDTFSIDLSRFTTVGTPTDTINTIRLIATGDNYYDGIYLQNTNPQPLYAEAKNNNSILKYGIKPQYRKTDGWSSYESANAFAKAFVNLYGNPAESYTKQVSLKTDINIGDMIDCDGNIYPVYKIVYDLNSGYKTISVGKNIMNTLEFLKATAKKLEALEKNIF